MKNKRQKTSLEIFLKASYISISIILLPYLLLFNSYDNKLSLIGGLYIFIYLAYTITIAVILKYYIFIDFNFIFLSIYFVYSIVGPLYYILFDASYITHEVYSGVEVVQKTLIYYFMFFVIFSLLSIVRPLKKETLNIKINKINNRKSILTDLIASGIVAHWILTIVSKVGFNIFSMSKDAALSVIGSSKIITYGGYYFIAYTVYYLIYYIGFCLKERSIKKLFNYRMFIIVAYYGSNLIIGNRRSILTILIMLFVFVANFLLENNQKGKFKYLFLVVGIVVLYLLFKGISREKYEIVDKSYKYVKFFGEFVYNQWVSYYYVNNLNSMSELLMGLSFYLYPIIFLFPRFIIPNKPEEFARVFWREAGTNQALAFNPVSEGILNFGSLAPIFTPVIYFMYLGVINYKKIAPYLYLTLIGTSMNICRGQFAIVFFEILFIFMSFKLINYLNRL